MYNGKYLNEVYFCEGIVSLWFLDIQDRDYLVSVALLKEYIFMIEIPQKFHLSQRTQTEHGMIKRCNLFDGNFLSTGSM
jgi:hypothetical protein